MAIIETPQTARKDSITGSHKELADVVDAAPLKDATTSQMTYTERFMAQDQAWRDTFEKKLLRKVDSRLLPLLILMYLLNFLDRANLAQARLGSLEDDLGMQATDFNLATAIFFVGYLTMQLPSNLLITRVKPSMYLGLVVMLWGVVSTCNSAVHSFGGLLAVRICLGIAEAPFFPGAIFLMSSWYKRSELAVRIAWFYSGNALANMFGGLIAAGVLGNLDGAHGIAGWRWLFIIEGVATIGVGFIAIFVLPNYPSTTRWLTEEEQAFAQYRLADDAHEADDKDSITVWEGVKLAFHDYRLYLFILLQHTSLLSQTFQYFFPSIVQTLGYGRVATLLLTVPVWFATFLVSLAVTYTAGRTGDRSIHIMCLMLIAAIGNAIATATTSTGPRFFAMFLMPMGAVASYQIIVAWVSNSFIRPLVKRSASIAVCNMIGNCASIYGSYMYPSSASPQYVPGGSANAVISVLVAVMALGIRLVHVRENRKLARSEDEQLREGVDDVDVAAVDGEVKDKRAKGFRYVL